MTVKSILISSKYVNLFENLVVALVPGLADGGDHLVNHGGAVGSLGNAGRRTGGISAGADATGSSSGIAKAPDRAAMVEEMIAAVRKAWDERNA